MKYLAQVFFMLLFLFSESVYSQTASTGLDECMDFVASASSTLTSQVNNRTYALEYGPAAYLDRANSVIYIQSYDCNDVDIDIDGLYFRISQLAHEFGHVNYDVGFPITTREAFIDASCKNEGNAVINNIVVRSEILSYTMQTEDISLAAANASQLLGEYAQGGPDPASSIGDLFCTGNITSTTGQNYKVYYGELYDSL